MVRIVGGGGWGLVLAGAELEGLALAGVPRLKQAGLGEHVRLIYVTPGPVADPGLDSTCPPSNQPPHHTTPLPLLLLASMPAKRWRKRNRRERSRRGGR